MGLVAAPGVATVEVDREALRAEADAIAASAAPPAPDSSSSIDVEGAPGAAAPTAAPGLPADPSARSGELQPLTRFAVAQLAGVVAPNWQVTADETARVGDALALVLAYWMPDTQIDPKYLALASLAGALWSVAESRRDESGRFKPLRAAPPVSDAERAADAAAPSPVTAPLSL